MMTAQMSATGATTLPTALAPFVETERRRADVAGIALAAFDREGIRFAGASGLADIARGEPVTLDTLFLAASISKLFTTTLVLQDVEAGTVGLDDPVNRHVDERSRVLDAKGRPAGDVTIRHLLTHSSGLPVSWRGLEYSNAVIRRLTNRGPAPRSLADVIAGMRQVRPAGKGLIYSNGAFSLLGHMAARFHGRPFNETVRERVFEPLGMERSSFKVEPLGPGVAVPYGSIVKGGAGRKPAGPIRNWTGPAGALVTSALDLACLGRMVLRGGELNGRRLLSAETLDEATGVHALNHPEMDEGIGLGFWVSRWRGHKVVSHGGGLAGVATRVVMLPEDGFGVTVLTNGGDPNFVHRVAERTLEDLLGLEPEAVPGSPTGVPAGRAADWHALTARSQGTYRIPDMLPPGLLGSILGRINRPRVSRFGGDRLIIDGLPGNEPAVLYPDGEPGRYRIAHPLVNGQRAAIEERPDGVHLWCSTLHLHKPR